MAQTPVTAADIAAWCDPDQETVLTFDQAAYAFHALGPRARFIQTTRANGILLDAGAGDGSSLTLRDWFAPYRTDLRMFAWASDKGVGFDRFDGHELGFWPDERPDFDGRQFDAILSANFIEHVGAPLAFVMWAASRLAPGGRLYLEWPRMPSMILPTAAQLAAHGVNVMTGRYDDDGTHRTMPPRIDDVREALARTGMDVLEGGTVSVPFLDQQLAIQARRRGDLAALTIAYWSHTSWCQYLVAQKGR